jgi:glycosyltransferase involved in cell wall biosynthesis
MRDDTQADPVAGRPVRVLMLAKGLGRGGAERLIVDAATALDPASIEVEVAYLLAAKDALVPELEAAGIPVHHLSHSLGDPRPWPAQLRRLVHHRSIDIVHTHSPRPAISARLALLGTKVSMLHTEHNVWHRYRRATRIGNALTYRRNDLAVAVSEAVGSTIRQPWGPRPVVVLRHGTDLERVRRGRDARIEARRRLGLPGDDTLVVGTVGNFTAKKDQAGLLEAFARTDARRRGARLVLVGSGPLETALRGSVSGAGLDDAVLFAGSRDDVPDLLAAFDLFVLSSRHEGLPVALVEAMAAGTACVATAVGGIPEMVRDGVDGVLVPASDPVALAAVIDQVLADPTLRDRLGAAAARSPALPDLSETAICLERLYRRLSTARDRRPLVLATTLAAQR